MAITIHHRNRGTCCLSFSLSPSSGSSRVSLRWAVTMSLLKSWFLTHHDWFVVDLPLWKIWKSVGINIPNIWKNKNVPNHRPDECMYNIVLKENNSCSNNPLGFPWKCHKKKKLVYDSWFILSSTPAELIPRFIFVDSTPVRCFRAWSGVTVLNMRLNLGLRQRVMDGKIGPKTCIVPLKLGIDPSKKKISPSKSRIFPSITWISPARNGSWLSKMFTIRKLWFDRPSKIAM